MASLLSRVVPSFAAIAPVPNLTGLDGEFTQLDGASGVLNGNTTAFKLLIKTSDAADPPVDLDQVDAGPILRGKQNGALKWTFTNAGALAFAAMTACANLNADQVDGIEGANIALLNTHRTVFSVSWFYPVMPGAVESDESVGRFIVPSGVEVQVTDITAVWGAGADSGLSNIFTIKRRNSLGVLQADVGTIDVNTNNVSVVQAVAVGPLTLTAGDQLYPLFTTRNAPTETLVTIGVRGRQRFTT